MKKLTIRFGIFFLTALITSTILLGSSNKFVSANTGDSGDIIFSSSSIISEIEDNYSNKDNLTVSRIAIDYEYYGGYYGYYVPIYEKKLDTLDYSQTSLNSYYNITIPNSNIGGTCTFVATTSIMEYYSRVKSEFQFNQTYSKVISVPGTYQTYDYTYSYNVQSDMDAFIAVYQLADLQGKIRANNGGTLSTSHAGILWDSYSFFGSNNTATGKLNVFDTVVSETNAGRPILFNVSNHTMVATGYKKYQVSYTETTGILWWKKTVTVNETEGVLVVNDGWGSSPRYTYFLESDIPSINLFYIAVRTNEN